MKILTLKRTHQITDGFFGILDLEGIPSYVTCELPWKDNKPNVSCVPKGEYIIERVVSERFMRELFRLKDVPNRSDCEIHVGNTIHDIEGCILLGLQFGLVETKSYGEVYGVLQSGQAFSQFMVKMTGENQAKLVIMEV